MDLRLTEDQNSGKGWRSSWRQKKPGACGEAGTTGSSLQHHRAWLPRPTLGQHGYSGGTLGRMGVVVVLTMPKPLTVWITTNCTKF